MSSRTTEPAASPLLKATDDTQRETAIMQAGFRIISKQRAVDCLPHGIRVSIKRVWFGSRQAPAPASGFFCCRLGRQAFGRVGLAGEARE